jgi:hypothetical protein
VVTRVAALVLSGLAIGAGVVALSRHSSTPGEAKVSFRATELRCEPGAARGLMIADPARTSGKPTAAAALRQHLRFMPARLSARAFDTTFESADHVEFVHRVGGEARYVAQASTIEQDDRRWVVRRSESCS